MRRRRPSYGPAITLPIILLVILVSFSILGLPMNPVLTVTFKILTPTTYPFVPKLEIVDATYAKASSWSTASVTKGTMSVSFLGATQGQFSLSITITYSGELLGTGVYRSLGEGLYQMRVVYLPRLGEQASIPYFITLSLSSSTGSPLSTVTLTIFPT